MQLARYINTTVNANLTTVVQSLDKNGILNEMSYVQNGTQVSSQVEFFGVEYTEPYYMKKEKKWYCVAYINRDRAWEQYVPQIEQAKKIFYGFYDRAELEKEPVFAISYYKSAWEKSSDFLAKLEYGRLIHPAEEKLYTQDRNAVANIPSVIESLKNQISVKIEIEGDYLNIVETALEESFKDAKFAVSRTGNYKAEVLVDPNVNGKNPLAVYPSVDLKLIGITGETVYSYKYRLTNRTVAYTLETAQKKSYPILAENILKTVPAELKELSETKK